MSQFQTIVEGPWKELELYAESIPNLLHWDFSYLWVLEKPAELRPFSWRGRLEAWKALLGSLAAGDLNIVEEAIPQPMLGFTKVFGIESISWLVVPRGNRRVGVLSPTVLVRPLPDFVDEDLDTLFRQNRIGRLDTERQAIADRFIAEITERLLEQSAEGSYGSRLAEVIKRELPVKQPASGPRPISIHHPFPLLRSRAWSPTSTYRDASENRLMGQIELPIHRGGIRLTYIPYCHCGKALLQKREAAPFVPMGNNFEVTCNHCKQPNTLALEDLLIWNRSEKAKVFIWEQDASLEPPQLGYPPIPTIQGSEVVFEWDSPLVAGDKDYRFLRLRFPSATVEARAISGLFYSKLLVPGVLHGEFRGLPVRAEWLAACSALDAVEIEVQVPAREVVFRNIRVKGWPTPIRRVYAGDLGLAVEPLVSVGIFPDPDKVCGNWRWFRAFLEGANGKDFEISLEGGVKILPTLVESLTSFPELLTVLRRSAPDIGVTFKTWRDRQAGEENLTAYLGIDFGTTGTLVYFKDKSDAADSVEPKKHGVRPSELAKVVKWLAGEAVGVGGTIGSFLPPLDTQAGRVDPYLIPTALWQLDRHSFIRWTQDSPALLSTAKTNFKWDKLNGQDFSRERQLFLSELILTTVPWVLDRLQLSQAATVSLDIGVAFPLAFDPKSRLRFDDLLMKLGQDLRGKTGLNFDFFSISEALACVDAFGQANLDEHYLIADFGGSTLDVALYTGQGSGNPPTLHQLGSIEFAGETFIQAFAAVKEADEKAQESLAWQVRDAILAGECRDRYGNEEAAHRVLSRFRAAAFEYLRTMAAAFSHEHKGEKVKLLLAGNAWHLSEAFDPGASAETWRTVFRRTYQGMVERVASDTLSLYESPEMDVLPSTKHYVVIGALNNAASQKKRRHLRVGGTGDPSVNIAEVQIRLPSGRQVQFSKVGANQVSRTFEWFNLVGEGAPHAGLSAPELSGSRIDCELDSMPPPSASWESYLLSAFKVRSLKHLPYPTPERLRAQLDKSLTGDPHGYLAKGPLQLILEKHWKEELKKV